MASVDYDALAREYSRHRRVHPEVLRRLLLYGKIERWSRVLEVGCGTGNYTAAIHRATGCESWGVDPSAARLQKATAQCPTARLQVGRAEALGVPDGAFDLVFSGDVIHQAFSALHLIAPEAFQRGLARLAHDLQQGPLPCVSRYVMLWGRT